MFGYEEWNPAICSKMDEEDILLHELVQAQNNTDPIFCHSSN